MQSVNRWLRVPFGSCTVLWQNSIQTCVLLINFTLTVEWRIFSDQSLLYTRTIKFSILIIKNLTSREEIKKRTSSLFSKHPFSHLLYSLVLFLFHFTSHLFDRVGYFLQPCLLLLEPKYKEELHMLKMKETVKKVTTNTGREKIFFSFLPNYWPCE